MLCYSFINELTSAGGQELGGNYKAARRHLTKHNLASFPFIAQFALIVKRIMCL